MFYNINGNEIIIVEYKIFHAFDRFKIFNYFFQSDVDAASSS